MYSDVTRLDTYAENELTIKFDVIFIRKIFNIWLYHLNIFHIFIMLQLLVMKFACIIQLYGNHLDTHAFLRK